MEGGETHQCHFKVVSRGSVIQVDLVPDLLVAEMSPEGFLLLSILNKRDEKSQHQEKSRHRKAICVSE